MALVTLRTLPEVGMTRPFWLYACVMVKFTLLLVVPPAFSDLMFPVLGAPQTVAPPVISTSLQFRLTAAFRTRIA